MKFRKLFRYSLLLVLIIIWNPISAQNLLTAAKQENQQKVDTAVRIIKPIPSTEITFASTETFKLLSESAQKKLKESEIEKYKSQIDTLVSQMDVFLYDSTLLSYEDFSARDLDNNMNTVQLFSNDLTDIQKILVDRSKELESEVEQLTDLKKRWKLTGKLAIEDDIPEAVQVRIQNNIKGIDSVRTLLQDDIETLLLLLDRLSGEQKKLETAKNTITGYMRLYSQSIFRKDTRNLFSSFSRLDDPSILKRRIINFHKIFRSDLVIFRTQFRGPIIGIGLLFVLLIIFFTWYRKNYEKMISVEKFILSDRYKQIINSPVLVSILIITVLIKLEFPDLPDTFISINSIILVIPVLILTNRLYRMTASRWVQWMLLIFVFVAIYELIFYPDIIQRLILLILSVVGFVVFLSMILKRILKGQVKSMLLYRLIRWTMMLFTLMLLIAIFANLVGAYRLSEFFTITPVKFVITAVAIYIVIQVADALLFLLMASNGLQNINVFKDNFEIIHRKSILLVNILLWAFFIVYALDLFMIKEPVFSWGEKVLKEGWKLGAVDITLGSILIFIFVIWISIQISRIVRAILEKDIFTRVTTAKGVPGTIIMLVRIGLIAGGFFLAAAAAGMELTNLSIIIGAFSVGIGFGLQNIFNNLVSGLILAFERPIKVGDVVQVGELMGIVLSIGFRSSTIRSFDGAEVIVPNGNLISNEMINWTLSDSTRRMDLRIGVAYGTDPEVVLDLIRQAALDHEFVGKEPPPKAYFIGFGDSSLNFRLLAWTDIEHRLEVESDLAVTINRRLKEAKIEIPFPQRDLHIRSDFRESH